MPPQPPPPTTQAPVLPDEILEDIFIRLPPDEPACLVRASLASKLWFGLLTGHVFRARYREFHGAPPMLGFFNSMPQYTSSVPRFVSTIKFGAHIPKDEKSHVMDCRHGRVLLMDKRKQPMAIVVWDPMTGCRRELYSPQGHYFSHGAAVLCAVTGCDHRACHEGPFQVVFVGLKYIGGGYKACAQVFLSDVGEWSDPCSCLDIGNDEDAVIALMAPVLIQDTLYFMFTYYEYGDDDADGGDDYVGIIKYDLHSKCLSLIDGPFKEIDGARFDTLIGMEDGTLGFVHMEELTLNLWSRQISSHQVAVWTPRIVIDLKKLLSIQNLDQTAGPIGCVEGGDIIFVKTHRGIYEINLNSLRWKKIWKRKNIDLLIPYMSFYNR